MMHRKLCTLDAPKTYCWFFFIILLLPVSTHARDLASDYAPVIVQFQDRQPLYDIITNVDFDLNNNGADNVANVKNYPLNAHVYGEVIAETQNAYFILYIFYHPKDYDTRLREYFFESASHDNDLEGAMMAVDKATGKIVALETWFHNLFMQNALTPKTLGSQTIDAKLQTEDLTHPILYIEPKGHGVRAFQHIDEARLQEKPHLIYRLGKNADDVKNIQGKYVSYTLLPLTIFYENAKGPFGEGHFLSEPGEFGLPEKLGKFMTGSYYGSSGWARPKPPWSWADKRDSLRYGAWFFHPAYSFYAHFGYPEITPYIYNHPNEKIIGLSQTELDEWAKENRDTKYFNNPDLTRLDMIRIYIKKMIYKWIEYLFFQFG